MPPELKAEARRAPDAALTEAFWQISRPVDVARRAQVVARHEHGVERARALVRHALPHRPVEHDRMAAHAAVGSGDDFARPLAPRGHDPSTAAGRGRDRPRGR